MKPKKQQTAKPEKMVANASRLLKKVIIRLRKTAAPTMLMVKQLNYNGFVKSLIEK